MAKNGKGDIQCRHTQRPPRSAQGEAVDVMVTCGGFPKNVNRLERIDVQMKHTQP